MTFSRRPSFLPMILVAAAAVVTVCGLGVPKAEAQLVVQWTQPPAELEELISILRQPGYFEEAAAYVDSALRLPRRVPIVFQTCGTANAFYQAEEHRILMCYELIGLFDQVFASDPGRSDEEIDEAILGSTLFFLLHEVGHALVHVLDLPITGKEEDAVDDLAALVMIEAEAADDLLSAAEGFDRLASAIMDSGVELPLWDEHSLEGQRAYTLACLVYGSNPRAYPDLVSPDLLPPSRAERCPGEYQQKSDAWDRLIAPYLREGH